MGTLVQYFDAVLIQLSMVMMMMPFLRSCDLYEF